MNDKAPRKQQKIETRQRILDAARQLFQDQGYDRTTLRQIGAAAGITAGNIFVHFPDKVALLVSTMVDTIDAELDAAMASFPESADLGTQLMHFPRHFFPYYAAHAPLIRNLFKATHLLTAECMEPIHAQLAEHLSFVAARIEAAKDRGEIHPDAVGMTVATAYWAYYHLALIDLLTHAPPDVERALALLEVLHAQLLQGIGPGRTS